MKSLKYRALIGVGGVGTGQFFVLNGDHTLGREESRSGHFLDQRDYCKLHIIAHGVRALLGPNFTTIPVSRVGADEPGRRLRTEMLAAGFDLRYLAEDPILPTLFSLCFQYPDGSGGNLTTDASAAEAVTENDVATVEGEFERFNGRGIALAAPESPPEARLALIRLGVQHHFFCAVALTAAETVCTWAHDLLRQAGLVALNLEEAASLARVRPDQGEPEEVVRAAVSSLVGLNPKILVSITAGVRGSWSWDGARLRHVPAFRVVAANTAGAGDAHLAGILAGLAWGLGLPQAQEIGTLAAAFSVTSPHTIHPDLRPDALLPFARQVGASLSPEVETVLAGMGE